MNFFCKNTMSETLAPKFMQQAEADGKIMDDWQNKDIK